MFLIILSAVLALVFTIGGFLVWLALFIFGVRKKGRKIAKWAMLSFLVFLPLFALLIFPLVTSYLIAHASTRPMDQGLRDTPANYGLSFTNIDFSSRDGARLKGWFIQGDEDKPAIILSHGLFRNRQEMLGRAAALSKSGYPTILFDFRGHGWSEQKPVSMGFYERLDVLGAYDFGKRKLNQDRFILLGVSMGAVAALHAAREFGSDLEALIADSPFQSLEETISHHTRLFLKLPAFPFANIFIWNLTRISDYDADQLDTVKVCRTIREVPVLLIYGKNDLRMPAETGRLIYETIPGSKKKLVYFPDAGHGASYRTQPESYIKAVLAFLDSLRSSPPERQKIPNPFPERRARGVR